MSTIPMPAAAEQGPSTTDGPTATDAYDSAHGTFKDDDVAGVSHEEQWGTTANPSRDVPLAGTGLKQVG